MFGGELLYLKRLEIQGFKSFADKVELEFNPGITVVVGPNGSGKSNVVDAIRWVLGEQSAKTLRGLRMDDIIFAGSHNRRPVGMARVSLTLDNSTGIFPLDFNEVTVSRRLYRSGESEYLINKVPCRLKDIHELFMDTGLGKEGFSVIGQGKIDEILSLKAEDRRNLIEEAAGIVKYRYRKREAQKKLGDTEQSLVRINDIISELTEQLEPLEEQANKARQYQSWKKELDQWEISLAVNALEENKDREQEIIAMRQKMDDELTENTTQYHQLESNIEELRLELQQIDQELTHLQQNYYDANSQLERKEHEIAMAKEKKAGLEAQVKRINSEQDNLVNEQAILQTNMENNKQELEKIQVEYQDVAAVVQELAQTINQYKEKYINNTNLLEEYKVQVIETLQENAKANNEITRIDNEIKNQQRRSQQLTEKLQEIKQVLTKIEKEKLAREEEELNLLETKKQIEHNVKKNQEDIEKNIKEQSKIKKSLEEKQINYQKLNSRLQVLQEMEETGEGYQQGVRAILGERRNKLSFKGIIGTVADIINVPKHLEVAVETALGGALQYIITENDDAAQKAINFLKSNKKGRATFLPLNTIKAKISNIVLKDAQVLGRAVDLINYEPRYKEIMEYLLGRIWIINDLSSAIKLGKENSFSIRMVTLDGEILTPGGALTGGNYSKQKTGLLTRKRLIKELSHSLIHMEKEVKNLKKELHCLENKHSKLVNEDVGLKASLQEQLIKLSEVNNKLDQISQDLKRVNAERQLYILEQQELTNQIEALETEKERQIQEVEKIKNKNQDVEQQIAYLQNFLKELAATQEDLNEKLNEKKIISATLKQSKDMGEAKFCELEQRLHTLDEDKKKLNAEIKELLEQIKQVEHLACRSEETIKELSKKLDKYQRDMEQVREKRGGIQETISSLETEVKGKQAVLDQLKNEKHQIDMKLTKVQMEISSNQEKLNQQFGCTYEEALAIKLEITSKRNVSKRVNELKEAINDLGLVNFAAITEYERVNERLQFLSNQYNDLDEAQNSLQKVIKEMDQIMVKKFQETYQLVNEAFNDVFSQMFDGGSAQLELSDTNNLLETGIEIIAQPPGKKPQSLSLLSGGERAMTAIALLFAILTVKPSPFCILDEIEAALDETNVIKFAKFLKNYTHKTQFIIISHRKGTMEAADVLYGVTMENTGVSKLISVRLNEAV